MEKRNFTRIPFDAKGLVKTGKGSWQGTVLDISLKGALVEYKTDVEVSSGDKAELMMTLNDGTTTITMEGHVAHKESDHIGITCDNIDLDSITNLRRLVELNLGSEDLLHRELGALCRK